MEKFPIEEGDVRTLLSRHHIAPTRQRVAIAQALLGRGGHFSAEQVLTLVNARAPSVSKATVYNTLKLFSGCGLIREVLADPTKVFYDANTSPHYHFYDVDSGLLTDIDAQGVALTGLPPLPEGTMTEGIEVVIRIRAVPPADAEQAVTQRAEECPD